MISLKCSLRNIYFSKLTKLTEIFPGKLKITKVFSVYKIAEKSLLTFIDQYQTSPFSQRF